MTSRLTLSVRRLEWNNVNGMDLTLMGCHVYLALDLTGSGFRFSHIVLKPGPPKLLFLIICLIQNINYNI
jgi:hypothetical protein